MDNSLKYVFFWGHKGNKITSMCSNFYITPFEVNFKNEPFEFLSNKGKVKFICGEQCMHWIKAVMFNDIKIAESILKSTDPVDMKSLGREVHGFDSKIWEKNRELVMHTVVHNKILQTPQLKKFVDFSIQKGQQFVEASPFDRIWGIGYDSQHAMSNIDNWGLNLLGKAINNYK